MCIFYMPFTGNGPMINAYAPWSGGEDHAALYRTSRTTTTSYGDLLEHQFLPDYDRLRPARREMVFQQDNAPVHTARLPA